MIPLQLNRLLVAALVWVIVAFLVRELSSLDVWWQLVIGEDILQQLRIPDTNLYSAGALNQPYHDSHWLFQVVLALFHRLAGLNGPILLMALVWGLVLLRLYRESRSYGGVTMATLMTFLAMGASAERFLPRPEMVTYLMIVSFYSRLRRGKFETPAQVALLLLLQIVWLNCHGLFVIGPFMVGCYWLNQGVEFIRKRDNHFKRLTALLPLIGAALLASPMGTAALRYSYLLFREVGRSAPAHMQGVQELSPTFGAATASGSAFWFFLVLLALVALATASNFRRVHLGRLLIVIALGLAASTGRRNIVLFSLVAAPFIAENLSPMAARFRAGGAARQALKAALVTGLLLWSLYPVSGRYYLDMEIPARFGLGVTPDFFPHGLKDFVERHGIRGQVFNTNRLGGYYMYQFYPDRIPLLDGRWEVYGKEFFDEQDRAFQDYEAWKAWIARYDIETALLHHTAPASRRLVPALYADPEWSLVYYDFAASLFVTDRARGSAPPIVFSASSRIPEGKVRVDSRIMLSVFYRNLGLDELLLENLALTLPSGRNTADILLEMAKIHVGRGELAAAEGRYLELLGIDDDHAGALSELSFIKYRQERYDESLDYSRRAIDADPGNIDLRFNHAMVLSAMGRDRETVELLRAILETDPDYWKARQLLEQVSAGGTR